MNRHTSLIFSLLLFLCIKHSQSKETSCQEKEECIPYQQCPIAKKIAVQILSTLDVDEKEKLTSQFKELRCGNFRDKTVCCGQKEAENSGNYGM